MNTFKKSVIAFATVATLAATAVAPAHAKSKNWQKGIGAGIGLGVGLGIAGALLNGTRQNQSTVYVQQPTVVVRQPVCRWQNQPLYDQYGNYAGSQNVQVCN
jgi:hypothetical protein